LVVVISFNILYEAMYFFVLFLAHEIFQDPTV